MATGRLTDTAIRNAKPTGKVARMTDGAGVYLEISPTGGKLWRWKFRVGGKEKRLGFGQYPDTGLKEARARCETARKLLASGVDPSAAYFSPSWTAFQADRGRDFSVIVDAVSA